MSATSDNLPPRDALFDRAVSWHVRLTSDAAEEADWLGFESWLAESPEHLRAYQSVEAVWSDLDAAPAAARTNITTLRPRPRRRPAARISAVAASLVAAFVLGLTLWFSAPRTTTYETAVGERRVIELADGSKVTLNSGSHVTARLGRLERRVEMADAEAVFDVAKDPSRPFLVQAGDREIRVVGTEFNVLRHSGDVRVTVRRGVVEVRPSGGGAAPPLARLQKAQSLAHREGEARDVIAAADPEAAFAWTEGHLIFRGERLEDVAVTLNRYRKKPIQVAPDARDLPVTAVLTVGPEDEMLRSLSDFLPVRAEHRSDSVRLNLRRQAH